MFRKTFWLAFYLLVPFSSNAETPQEKGLAIAIEMDQRNLGWTDSESTVKMILRTSSGKEVFRNMRMMGFEINEAGLGDHSLTLFDSPRDVRGTALLTHTRITEQDAQWLYLPALKRVKRISSGNKSGPFVGSEFAYEDLLSQEVEKYTYTYLRDEACVDETCFVVERIPVYEDSGYTKQISWIDQSEYRVFKTDFYDRGETLFKTLTFSDFKKYQDKYWRAQDMTMVNHQTGKSTTFLYEAISLNTGLKPDLFQPNKLSRVR